MKILIVDDEESSIRMLASKLEEIYPRQFEIFTAYDSVDATLKIATHKPKLVFLDIQMPGMNGFELLATLKNVNFKVIFITAHNEYAIRAIRFNALDYLLKPIVEDELIQAMTRFQQHVENVDSTYNEQLKNVLAMKNQRLAISTYEGVVFLDLDKIIRCEAELNYTKFYLSDNTKLISSKTLKEYEELLFDKDFIRVHRSHLINVNFVAKFKNDGSLVLKDKTVVPISRRKKDIVSNKFGIKTKLSNSFELEPA